MMNWLKHYFWFIKESAKFLDCSFPSFVAKGGLLKGFKYANSMVKWDKMTDEQREHWYLTEDRTIEL